MGQLIIIKTGSTFLETLKVFGDFDRWIRKGLGAESNQVHIINVDQGDPLPLPKMCRGVVLAGSHAMVTDRLPWMTRLAAWISDLMAEPVPLLGICFGHQLLAQALGGEVGYHPGGKEIGTVDISLLPESVGDPLFSSLPQQFPVHTTHRQTVVRLPASAVRLALNAFEPNYAFRLGRCAWGVQFHPEFDARIMESYLSVQSAELRAAGLNVSAIRSGIKETPTANQILPRFAGLALDGKPVG